MVHFPPDTLFPAGHEGGGFREKACSDLIQQKKRYVPLKPVFHLF
jgi:hypothetical protein